MVTKEQVIKSLEAVLVPAAKRSIVGLNLVREVTVADGKVTINLASTGLIPGAQDWIKTKVREAVEKMAEFKEVAIEYNESVGSLIIQIEGAVFGPQCDHPMATAFQESGYFGLVYRLGQLALVG